MGGSRRVTKKRTGHVAEALQYARDVVAGKVPACKWVRLACQRHLDDLKRAKGRDYRYKFDPAKAERACKFMELLPHTKGRWAISTPGRPGSNLIRLERWQKFWRCCVFGWVHKSTGFRRFRKVYLCVPRKNGKSIEAAGTGLYMLAADGEHGAEVYSGATTERQAWEVFRPAKVMAERTEGLRKHFKIAVNAKNLHRLSDGSRFEPVVGKPGDGSSPSCAIIDEYHEHPTDELLDTMETGMGAREQPLLLIITTAGEDIASPCYALQEDVQKILEGSVVAEEVFGIIYTIDEDDDWTDPAALEKANPNIGVSVSREFLLERLAEALRSPRKANVYKTKHLNVWVHARDPWMNMEDWKACGDAPPISEFDGESCWLGLDLNSKIDIASKAKIFRRRIDGELHYFAYTRNYIPQAQVEQSKNRHYQEWVDSGKLVATDGAIIDYGFIRGEVEDDADQHQVEEIGYDPWNMQQMAQELGEDERLTLVEVPQRTSHLSEPMKSLEALALARRFHHDNNDCTNWQVSNVKAKTDANDNVFPRKESPEQKIDAAVALIIALGRALVGEESEEEDGGLLVFG